MRRQVSVVGAALAAVLVAGCGSSTPTSSPTTTTHLPAAKSGPITGGAFSYGFDFTAQAPIDSSANASSAVSSARSVLSRFAGSYMDVSIYGFGLGPSPEPSPGDFDMSAIAQRIALVQAAGGIPVITLTSEPSWMRDGVTGGKNRFTSPPTPDHFADFATLCAHIATSFPQVKYFVVWSELRGFMEPHSTVWNAPAYTSMYNDVYQAIKAVRPDAEVGGPYAPLTSYSTPVNGVVSTLHGSWGYLNQNTMDAFSYWLAHRVGADFVAVDGSTDIAKQNESSLSNAATASEKYAAVDQWIRSQTTLPIWWMESHIQPSSGWTSSEATAARVATLAYMATSGARVGMQWQPQQQTTFPDEGLWTSTTQASGGQPTQLASVLLQVLPVLTDPVTLAPGEPSGVVVVNGSSHVIAVNTTGASVQATESGSTVTLAPYSVSVR